MYLTRTSWSRIFKLTTNHIVFMCGVVYFPTLSNKPKVSEKLGNIIGFDRLLTYSKNMYFVNILWLQPYIHSTRTAQWRYSQFSTAALSSSLESGAHSVVIGIIIRFAWVGENEDYKNVLIESQGES